MGKYIQKAMTIYSAEDMIEDMTAVYQRHLTGADVDAMIAFYSSPAGQHLLDAQPSIMKEYMPIGDGAAATGHCGPDGRDAEGHGRLHEINFSRLHEQSGTKVDCRKSPPIPLRVCTD